MIQTNFFAYAESGWHVYSLNSSMYGNNVHFKIPYKIINGTLETITTSPITPYVILEIKGEASGSLSVTIPRNLLNP
ncbi:MAG TPA: hypothetical protein VFG24_07960, partial [Nitrosopumilaceae archaeon]|nr:hypothetical protein [Nitrosopumilaceae archaeon]